jgi:hypothetical protein
VPVILNAVKDLVPEDVVSPQAIRGECVVAVVVATVGTRSFTAFRMTGTLFGLAATDKRH